MHTRGAPFSRGVVHVLQNRMTIYISTINGNRVNADDGGNSGGGGGREERGNSTKQNTSVALARANEKN